MANHVLAHVEIAMVWLSAAADSIASTFKKCISTMASQQPKTTHQDVPRQQTTGEWLTNMGGILKWPEEAAAAAILLKPWFDPVSFIKEKNEIQKVHRNLIAPKIITP